MHFFVIFFIRVRFRSPVADSILFSEAAKVSSLEKVKMSSREHILSAHMRSMSINDESGTVSRLRMIIAFTTTAELLSIRTSIFAILDKSKGRWLSKEEFANFCIGIHKLAKSGCHQYRIKSGNMSEEENEIVRSSFGFHMFPNISYATLAQIFEMPNVLEIYQGISEYRIEVEPEFARLCDNNDTRKRLDNGILLELIFLQFCKFKIRDDSELGKYFSRTMTHLIRVVEPEYLKLED